MKQRTLARAAATLSVTALSLTIPQSHATNGYFAHGFGTQNKGMGGVGMAMSQDSFAPATNPAGIAGMESRVDGALAYFRPERSYKVTGDGLEVGDLTLDDLDVDLTETVEDTFEELADQLDTTVDNLLGSGGTVDDIVDDLQGAVDSILDPNESSEEPLNDLNDTIIDAIDDDVALDAAKLGDTVFLSLVQDTLVPLNTNGEWIESREKNFFIPSFAFVRQINDRSSWGVTVVGNGGLNTNYPGFDNKEGCQGPLGSEVGRQSGPFCDGAAGVDLMQLMVMPTFATSFGDQGQVRAGVSPILSYQRFEAFGLSEFEPLSDSPEKLSDQGYDDSFGYGIKVGLQADVADHITLGASYQSRQAHDGFDDYEGLFAEQGDFDIPSTWGVGIAVDVTRNLTVAADYQRINYSDVDSLSNSVTNLTEDGNRLGSSDGPGFGWEDINVYKVGAQYDGFDGWSLRAGYNRGDNPIPEDEVTFNILAPGVMTEHYTLGATRELSEDLEISFSAMYAPKESVKGDHAFFEQQDVEIEMEQYEVEVGFGYRF
ncbi:OmpP1/FadL family transporter [Thioalkalivibrio sp. ALJ24]|uniref:OmpP1/FadL family transporter n=1 Tax=Thioalkalivibrio sp. ALJ24 TaxID=545276 RepID=UPI00039C1BE3|nr:outer membrane protein transport protein [Thioalkalivibrio sp. ALJ24]